MLTEDACTRACAQKEKIVWISFLVLDLFLHKTSKIEILKQLSARGYDVHLFAIRSKKNVQLNNSNVHLIAIPLRYFPMVTTCLFAFLLFIFLPFYIIIKRPNVIITQSDPSILGFVWKPLFRPFKLKVILDIRSTPVEINSFRDSLGALWFNISVVVAKKLFDGITTITPLMKKEVCDKFQIDPNFIGVWTSGVSTTLFEPERFNGSEMRKKLGLANKFIIMYHGRFDLHKGIIESVKGIEKLESKYHDVVLFMFGNGPALPVLKKLVRKKRIMDKAIIHDAVDYEEVPKYISMCDVGIVPLPDLPYWRHQCPLKLLEYLAMKKVVIVTDIPAHRQIVGKSKCGVYISSVDPREIAKAIAYAYDNRERLKDWGSYGRRIVEEKYDWRKCGEDFENYLLAHLKRD